jgi:hypothetical protein
VNLLLRRLEGFKDLPWQLRNWFLQNWYRPELEALYDATGAKRLDEANRLQEELRSKMGDHPALAKTRVLIFRIRTIGR